MEDQKMKGMQCVVGKFGDRSEDRGAVNISQDNIGFHCMLGNNVTIPFLLII